MGHASIHVEMQCWSSYAYRKLDNVLHVPSFGYLLLSVSARDKKGIRTTLSEYFKCIISKGSMKIATGTVQKSLFVIPT